MSIFVHFHSLLDYFNVSLILELNSEFRDFKLWDQKLQFKGFVSEILLEYFWGILKGVVGWCEGAVYLTSPGRPADIGLQLGKACYPCSR